MDMSHATRRWRDTLPWPNNYKLIDLVAWLMCLLTVGFSLVFIAPGGAGLQTTYHGLMRIAAVIFMGNSLIAAAALVRAIRQHPKDRGLCWACGILIVTQWLNAWAAAVQVTLLQNAQTFYLSSLLLYAVIYLGGSFGLGFIVPFNRLARAQVQRLGAEAALVLPLAHAVLVFAINRLFPELQHSPMLSSQINRLVTTIALTFWFVSAYRRFALFRDVAVMRWALGLGCLATTDILLTWVTIKVATGTTDRLFGSTLPIYMLHQTLWCWGLYATAATHRTWQMTSRSKQNIHVRHWLLKQQSLLLVVLIVIVTGNSPSLTTTLWLVIALISHAWASATEMVTAQRELATAHAELAAAHAELAHYTQEIEGVAVKASGEVMHRVVSAAGRDEVPTLSERELEVVRLLADGRSNPEIAASLVISEGTARSHVRTVLSKLGVHDRADVAARLQVLGILED